MLLVALGIVFSFIVVTPEKAENINHAEPAVLLNYSRISLPPEHLPYFFNNNKGVAMQCQLDPLCPFKVRYELKYINMFSCTMHVLLQLICNCSKIKDE